MDFFDFFEASTQKRVLKASSQSKFFRCTTRENNFFRLSIHCTKFFLGCSDPNFAHLTIYILSTEVPKIAVTIWYGFTKF
jgi:hypothetical protein